MTFELVTREGCHLCDVMAEALDRVLPPLGIDWQPIDVDRDDLLRERYGEVVPVLLRDGRPVAKVRVSDDRLRRLVRRRR